MDNYYTIWCLILLIIIGGLLIYLFIKWEKEEDNKIWEAKDGFSAMDQKRDSMNRKPHNTLFGAILLIVLVIGGIIRTLGITDNIDEITFLFLLTINAAVITLIIQGIMWVVKKVINFFKKE